MGTEAPVRALVANEQVTSESVYYDEAISVGKVLGNTSNADAGIASRGAIQDTDTVLVKRTTGAITDTGYATAVALQTYFNTGAGSWDFSGLDAGAALASADLALVMQSGTPKKTTMGAIATLVNTLGSDDSNYEVLAGDKTLSITSPRNQFLVPGAASRNVDLDATCNVAGTRFVISNVDQATGNFMVVRDSAASNVAVLQYGESRTFVHNGSAWLTDINQTSINLNGATLVGFRSTNTTYIAANGSAIRISTTDTGVGIKNGAVSPSALFHVSAAGNANALLVDDTTGHVGINTTPDAGAVLIAAGGGSNAQMLLSSNTAYLYQSDGTRVVRLGIGASQISLGSGSSHSVDFIINDSAKGRIQTTGELTWGSTTNGTGQLQVTGSTAIISAIDASATGNPKVSLYQTTTERAYLQYVNTGAYLNIVNGDAIQMSPGAGQPSRFHPSGAFTVGTATDDAATIGGFESSTLAMILPLAASATITALTPSGTHGAIMISSSEDKIFVWNGTAWKSAGTT